MEILNWEEGVEKNSEKGITILNYKLVIWIWLMQN